MGILSVLQPFPDLKAVHGDSGIGLEAQPDAATGDFKHRNFQDALEAARATDYHCFQVFSGQDQHVSSSVVHN
jgi:hypothetical protein